MKEKTPILASVLAVSIIMGMAIVATQPDSDEFSYIPSDLSKAFPELDGVRQGSASFTTIDIEDVKNDVDYTIRGTVVKIGELEFYENPIPQPEELKRIMPKLVLIPIEIKIQDMGKGLSDVDKGDTMTIKLQGGVLDNILHLDGGEPQFEVGEDVLVHVSVNRSDIIERGLKYVKLGEFGKYQIQNDMAYNTKYPDGKRVQEALNEAK